VNVLLVNGFDPIVGENARVVVLGTLPGGVSLKSQKYYADPGNAFWFIAEQLFGISRNGSYDERKQGLIRNRIAIWDVLKQAERTGSRDETIGKEVANDFTAFFRDYPSLKGVFFNGKKAEEYFRKLVVPALQMGTGFPRLNPALPSTSKTNAHCKRAEKVESWRVLLRHTLSEC
jgi:double-stranded uracil-DNA glycosylase